MGHGPEQTDPAENDPAHCNGVGLDDLLKPLPNQPILQLHEEQNNISEIHTLC